MCSPTKDSNVCFRQVNSPDLCLFVGEALVGNDSVDQLKKFNQVRNVDASFILSPRH